LPKPKITIGICVKNAQNILATTIESIISQDYDHKLIEIIFVDDGSQDKTLSIIENQISNMDIGARVFSHKWKGLGPSRNVVVDNAKGDYIIWVDGDLKLSRDYVRRQVEFMEKNPRAGIAKGKFWDFKDIQALSNQNLVAFLEHVGFIAVDIKSGDMPNKILPGTAGSIYKLKAIRQVGGFDNYIRGAGEDIDAAYRIRKKGWLIYHATSGVFITHFPKTWSSLFRKYYWYGYGLVYVYLKNKEMRKLWYLLPPTAFLSGLLSSSIAYEYTRCKAVFLLPFHFLFKMTAWWFGFINGYFSIDID
jgi:glycosyltransferase involved in cell wall biosynthesis